MTVDHVRLAPGFSDSPTGDHRYETERRRGHGGDLEPAGGEQPTAPPQDSTGNRHGEEDKPAADHDPKGEEDQGNIGPIGGRHGFQALNMSVPRMCQIDATDMRN